jgi:hypothetical protein
LLCSLADLLIVPSRALAGLLMAPLLLFIILGVAAAGSCSRWRWTGRKRAFAALEMR